MRRGDQHLTAVRVAERYVLEAAAIPARRSVRAAARAGRIDPLRSEMDELAELPQRPVVGGQRVGALTGIDDHRRDALLTGVGPGARNASAATADQLAKSFKGARVDRVAEILESLSALGQIREVEEGKFVV